MSNGAEDLAGYCWSDDAPTCAYPYLFPAVKRILDGAVTKGMPKRLFDFGCGNGSMTRRLGDEGWDVFGVDPSIEGITQARAARPGWRFEQASDADDLAARFGTWPFVLCLEVVEHVYNPHRLARRIRDLLEPSGVAVISTPYHGYLKNLALSIVPGAWDRHWGALRTGGHIKFWSEATLGELLREAGFCNIEFQHVGRAPMLAKSMIAVARG